MRNKRGFTLLELLVVVLIIGVLTAVGMPQYMRAVNKSKTAEGLIALMAITAAQESYFLANGTYTANLDDLEINPPLSGRYYRYECDLIRTCFARPKYKNMPVLEFHMQRASQDSLTKYLGKHWCQTANIGDPKDIATAICQSLGVQDPSMATGYYVLK